MPTVRTPRAMVVEETIDLSTGVRCSMREPGGFSVQAWLSEARDAAGNGGNGGGRASPAVHSPRYGGYDAAAEDGADAPSSVRSSGELRIGGFRGRPAGASPLSFKRPDSAPRATGPAAVLQAAPAADPRMALLQHKRSPSKRTPPATPARDPPAPTEGEAALSRLADAQLAEVAARAGRLARLDRKSSQQRSPPMDSPSMPSPPATVHSGGYSARTTLFPSDQASAQQQLQALQQDRNLLSEVTTLKLELLQTRTQLSAVQRALVQEQQLRQRAEAAAASATVAAAAQASRHQQQLRVRAQLPPVLVSPSKPRAPPTTTAETSTQTETTIVAEEQARQSMATSTTDVAQLLEANRRLLDSCSRPMRTAATAIQAVGRGFLARKRLATRRAARALELAAPQLSQQLQPVVPVVP